MKIALVSTCFPQMCGVASYTHYLVEALCAEEPLLDLTIIAPKEWKSGSERQVHVFKTFDRDGDFPAQVLVQIRRLAPEIVHVQHEYGIFGYDGRFLQLLSALRENGTRTVVTLHTVHTRVSINAGCTRPDLRRLLRKIDIEEYQRRLGELADLLIVHQEQPIRQVLLRQRIVSERIETVPHGTLLRKPISDVAAKAKLGVPCEVPLLVAFGYFEPSKNVLTLLEAFRRVRKRVAAKLWLGGHVRFPAWQTLSYRAQCLEFIRAHQLEHDVILTDEPVPEEQVPHVLGAADIACFVYDEDTRSSSGALHLALGLGKAIVASRISKFHELAEISDEILVNPKSAKQLDRVLMRLLLDDPFRQAIEQRVRAFALQTSWFTVARMHLRVYRRLARTNGGALAKSTKSAAAFSRSTPMGRVPPGG